MGELKPVAFSFRAFLATILAPALLAAEPLGSAKQGMAVLEQQGCVQCHQFPNSPRVGGVERLLRTRHTPSSLTGAIWNHGPQIFSHGKPARFQPSDAFQLLFLFAAAGFFEQPGDPRRGVRTFTQQGCAVCHQEEDRTSAPPVSRWPSLSSSTALFVAMWRHAPVMREALDARRMPWPSLSSTEIRDILAYARQGNGAPQPEAPHLQFGDPEQGKALLTGKACLTCHRSRLKLEGSPRLQSFTNLAGVLWNHAPMMLSVPPVLDSSAVDHLLGYLWDSQYFEEPGNAAAGRNVFELRRCAACHSTFPGSKDYDATSMLAALWRHQGPVFEKSRGLGIVWPRFTGADMANVIAYANSVRRPALVK